MFCIDLSLILAHVNPSGLSQVLPKEGSDHVLARPRLNCFAPSRLRPIALQNTLQFDIIFLLLLTIAILISLPLLAFFSNYNFLDFSFHNMSFGLFSSQI